MMVWASGISSTGNVSLHSSGLSRCMHSHNAMQNSVSQAAFRSHKTLKRLDHRRAHCQAALSNRSMLYLSGGAEADQSAGNAADALKTQLQELEEERKAATLKAEHMASKSQRLAEAIENLQAGALRAMRQQDEAAARELLQEKTIVTTALHKSKERAALNFTLAEKLNKLIGAKQTELIALLHRSGSLHSVTKKPFSVNPAGMVSMDESQPSTAEGLTNQQPGTDIRSQSRSGSSPQYTSPALTSQDYQSEEEIDNKFLELERQTLESMMQASRLDSQQDSGAHEQSQQHSSSDSATSSSSSEAESASHSGSSNTSGSNWWHTASSHLQQVQQRTGPLESHQAHEMAKDVTTLLTRIINARVMRGLDPKATQLVDLAVFQVGVAASADPAVRIAPPRTDFSINIRQRLFRDATAAALEACSASAAGRVTPAWQELASNWADKQGADSAVAGSPDVTGKLAQMFLRSLAELFQLEQRAVESIVHAAVAAHTRARLLDAVAAVKQAEPPAKAEVAREEMRHLAAVVDAFPLPLHSPEMELVHSGLRGFLEYQDRKVLHEAYQQVSSSQASVGAVADALGMSR